MSQIIKSMEVAKILGVARGTVVSYGKRKLLSMVKINEKDWGFYLEEVLNFKKPEQKSFFTDNERKFIHENYPLHGARYCSEKLNKSIKNIRMYIGKNKIKVDKEKWQYKKSYMSFDKYNINPEQFLDPQTPEVAYILGLLWADGYISTNKNFNQNLVILSIILTDGSVFRQTFEKTGKWTISEKQSLPPRKPQLLISTRNMFIYKFLLENDYQSKSWESADKILSKIPEHLKHYWFRGLVDGDGCIYVNLTKPKRRKEIVIASGYDQNWKYMEDLCKNLDIDFIIKRNKTKNGSSSNFKIGKTNSVIKFCNYIYQNYEIDKIGLTRKYEKWKIVESNFKPTK